MHHKPIVLILLLLLSACSRSEPDAFEVSAELAPRVYDGFAEDRALLRQTIVLHEYADRPDFHVSGSEAIDASRRVFDRINFVGLTRDDALYLLGPPETISDYEQTPRSENNDLFAYTFANGLIGDKWILRFEDNIVIEVEHISID